MATLELSGEKLADVSSAVGKIKAEFFGRGPEEAKAYLNGSLLVIVFRGGFLDVEETLITKGRGDKVRDLRTTWQEELDVEITRAVADVTGLEVVDYFSQALIDARMIVELFVLAES